MVDDGLPARAGLALTTGGSEAVIVADRQGRIVLWNSGAERMFGFPASAALGASLDIIIPESLRTRHWKGYDEVLATGRSRYSEGDLLRVPGLHADGGRLSIEFTLTLLNGEDGAIEYFVAVMRDQTKRFNEMKILRDRLKDARS